MTRATLILSIGLGFACTPGATTPAGGRNPGVDVPADTVEGFCDRVSSDGFVGQSGRVVSRCADVGVPSDHAPLGCTHSLQTPDGEVEIAGALRVLDAGARGLVIWGEDQSLLWRDERGGEQLLARWADDPQIGRDGAYIAYLSVADADLEETDHGPQAIPGANRSVVLQALDGTPLVLVDDRHAASPWPLPGGVGVLYVSGRSGLASLFRADLRGQSVQLTNLGLDAMGQEAIPVPAGELVWLEGPRPMAVFTSRLQRAELWLFDADTGAATLLGPGDHPVVAGGDTVIARGGQINGCALVYSAGGAS